MFNKIITSNKLFLLQKLDSLFCENTYSVLYDAISYYT